jgi:hypothetical protein
MCNSRFSENPEKAESNSAETKQRQYFLRDRYEITI